MAREPGYCYHKTSKQAYVNLGGKVIYLGPFGSAKSVELYSRLKAEWLVNRHSDKFRPSKKRSGPTIADVCLAFLDYAKKHYSESNEYTNFKLACNPLSELYATLPASDFGVIQFKVVRDWWLKDTTRSRGYINRQCNRVIAIMKWSAGEGMLPPTVHQALRCVTPLKRGRTTAKESKPVKPVAKALVEATIPLLTPVLADMLRLQELLACRPGEVCAITPAMVDRSSEVWKITLEQHKTAHRGKARTIYVGPRAQAILSKYLSRPADQACFSPIESERQRLQVKHDARVTPLSCGNRPGSNRIARKPRKAPGSSYSTGAYGKAIRYACKRGKLEMWSPNQLRHSAATNIRRLHGIEGAQVILGHSEIGVTQIYAERDIAKAIGIAKEVG